MKPVTEQHRVDTFRNSPEAIRVLYSSDALSELTGKLYDQFNIEQSFRSFSEIIGDTILGFNKISDMPRLFQQKLKVSADDSQRMTSQLIEMLEPVVKREEDETIAKKESMTHLANSFAKPEGLGKPTQPEAMEKVEPIRTMAQDMNRVHGYGAYRAQEEASQNEQAEEIASTDTEAPPEDVDNSHR